MCSDDVVEAFASLGIECTATAQGDAMVPPLSATPTLHMHTLQYEDCINADDTASLRRFALEESGANSFHASSHVTAAEDVEAAEASVWAQFSSLIDNEHRVDGGRCSFGQRIGVFVFRQSALLPDMVSDHVADGSSTFYNDAYLVRRAASTMQSNAMAWLTKHASALLPSPNGEPKRMLSIGCGSGELEMAFLDGCPDSLALDFLGLEPSDEMRSEFGALIKERRNAGRLGHNKSFALSDATFPTSRNGLLESAAPYDIVFLGHVLYYFDDPAATIEKARKLTRAGGKVVVVHQSAQGIPELQLKLLPLLRGSTADMLSADDLVASLPASWGARVEEVPALLDISQVVAGTEAGRQLMASTLEVDLRTASQSVVRHCQASFLDAPSSVKSDDEGIGPTGAAGPFLREPVSIITIDGLT